MDSLEKDKMNDKMVNRLNEVECALQTEKDQHNVLKKDLEVIKIVNI